MSERASGAAAASTPESTGVVRVRRALLSVSDKSDLLPFASALAARGVELVSTGGTAKALEAAGLPVIPIERLTGMAEMMDGRVKTLHPAVHGGLLARRDVPAHVAAMAEHGIGPIDLICINLYPFERTIAQEGVADEEAIEQIDIGGPAMIRSAAKNHDSVAVVTDPSQYDRVAQVITSNDGATTLELRHELAAAAFRRTAAYDTAIAAWMDERREEPFPEVLRTTALLVGDLRYGENPHQRAAVYRDPASPRMGVVGAALRHGKPLSYNNLNDAAAALGLIEDLHALFREHVAAVVVKHTNPCGAAIAPDAADAFLRAEAGDPLAAFGGVVALTHPVDAATARVIVDGERFLEVIVAPSFDDEALALLGERWKNVRLLEVGAIGPPHAGLVVRSIAGGLLVQERDVAVPDRRRWQHVAGPSPSEALLDDACMATALAKGLTSNAVCIVRDRQLLGAGAGQMDRVAACRLAIEKAGDQLTGSAGTSPPVAGSDAFFPFADGPQLLIDAGVGALIHPGGSKRDQETVDLCNARGVTCLMTGMRHFRH